MDRLSRQKINKKTQDLNNRLDQINLIDIYRTFHPEAGEYTYTFFSSAHGKFSRIDHMLGHKTSLSKLKKIETILSIFSDHNTMKLEINYKEKNTQKHKHVQTDQYAANHQWITDEMKEEIKKYLESREHKTTMNQNII